MPATKNRGKSAAFLSTSTTNLNQYSNNNNNVSSSTTTNASTSLLKIESVVPSLVKKPNKSIFRSYSTLSTASGNLKNPNFIANKSSDKRNVFGKDQHLAGSNNNNNNVQTNGVWRINRSSKEKEKLPDRINLDRRGLTSLPIIDDEQNLRLLSLQHNLINSFCVPARHIQQQQPSTALITEDDSSAVKQQPTLQHQLSVNNEPLNRKLDQLKSITESSKIPLTKRNLFAQKSMSSRSIQFSGAGGGNRHYPQLPPPSPINLSANPSNIMKNSFIQKSVLLHAKEKYVFKKSNSFIHNYSQHLAASKLQLGQLMQNRLSTMSSFSNDPAITNNAPHESNTTTLSATSINESNGNKMADNLCIQNEQFNGISDSLQNLVFLDLYDNQIEKISTLDGLRSLTVLLLGKNRITDISGIVSVKKTLRVLDLHGNKITNITQRICQLQELKSLNLAGNNLRLIHIDDFKGLLNLRELNLKRNKIKRIHGFDDLRCLERLWLCHNELQKVEDMSCIAKAINLKEITIENNPVSLGGDCVSFLVSYLPNLLLLSQMQVTDQVRRAAMAWRKNKENSDANYSHLTNDVSHSIRREEVISNARTNWELLRSQQHPNNSSSSNKSSTFIQKTIRNASQQLQVLVSDIDVDVFNIQTIAGCDLTNGTGTASNSNLDRKFLRQKTMATRLDARKRLLKASRRSLSQENASLTIEEEVTAQQLPPDDFFRLPPILAPFLDHKPSSAKGSADAINRQNDSSGSSLGPNIDSLSSCLSSDAEDSSKPRTAADVEKISSPNSIQANKADSPVQIPTPNSVQSQINDEHQLALPEILSLVKDALTETVEETHSKVRPSSSSIIRNTLTPEPQLQISTRPPPPSSSSSSSSASSSKPHTHQSIKITKISTKNNPEDNQQWEKNSNLSTTSNKTISEISSSTTKTAATTTSSSSSSSSCTATTASNTTPNTNDDTKSQKCRSANPNRKYTSPLIRAQTAKNIQIFSPSFTNGNGGIAAGSNSNQSNKIQKNITANNNGISSTNLNTNEREREQGGDYLIEICGRYLNVYGAGAIKFIDRQWNTQKAHDVHTFKISYVNFNSIAVVLSKIKVRFPNAENFVFRETNIGQLGQLNALAEIQGITSLIIDPEGNAICNKNWRPYAIYRLSHWGIKTINGIDVTEEEIDDAHKAYAGLYDLVLWSLPETLLEPLLARLRLDETCTASKLSAKQWLMNADPSLKIVVGKEALQCKRLNTYQDETLVRQRGKNYFSIMMENTCNAVEKLQKLETLWPMMLVGMVRNTLLDYSQIDVYVKSLLSEMMKNGQ